MPASAAAVVEVRRTIEVPDQPTRLGEGAIVPPNHELEIFGMNCFQMAIHASFEDIELSNAFEHHRGGKRCLSHWNLRRIRFTNEFRSAEALRDALLAVSGQIHPSSGGPALPLEFPENVANINPENVNPPSFSLTKWRPEHPYVRTIYLPVIRSGAQPGPAELRNIFDFTQPAEFAGQRAVTAVPTQALFLMNSAVVKGHAKDLARRLQDEAPDGTKRIGRLWLCVLNRPITSAERNDAEAFLANAGENNWIELCHAVLASNEFLVRL